MTARDGIEDLAEACREVWILELLGDGLTVAGFALALAFSFVRASGPFRIRGPFNSGVGLRLLLKRSATL